MRKTVLFFSIFVLFLVFACSKKPESEATVEIIDGVENVHNTGTPMNPDKSVSFEEELSVGGKEYDMLSRPILYIVDKEDRILISDMQDQAIKVFDSNGNFIQTIGRQGEGPGEFSYVGRMAFLPDGRLMVTDSRANRISLFDREGTYLNSHHWSERMGRLHSASDVNCIMSVTVFEESGDGMEGRKLFVKKFDFEGNEILTLGEFQTEEVKTHSESTSSGGVMMFGMSVPHSPHSIFIADQARERLYHCVNDVYMIEVFDFDGNVIRKIDRPYDALPFTGEDAKKFRSRYDNSKNEDVKKMVQGMSMPALKTITPQMRVDDAGNLWVETHEEREEENQVFTAYDIFNPDGYYEAKVWVDLKPEIFMNGKMYRFHTDEESGYMYVKRYRVVWNK
jgi:hypothetical protein